MSAAGALGKLNQMIERSEKSGGDRPKATWLTLKAGQTVTISFLQELDEDSEEYNETSGTVLVVEEHSNPSNFKRKALCSLEAEGRCYACEMAQTHPKQGWAKRGRLYANVLVEDGANDPSVAVLSQGIGDKSVSPALAAFANENGYITKIKFSLKRSGMGTKTGYTLMPKIGTAGASLEGLELFDLKACCTATVEYEKQSEFYGAFTPRLDDDAQDIAPPPPADPSLEW